MINKYITVGGQGTRLNNLSTVDKQHLYYQDKKIIEHILCIFPDAQIVGQNKTASRLDTLKLIKDKNNILVIDCDIIPFGINIENLDISQDAIYVFNSKKNKYGSVIIENNRVIRCSENNSISNTKCSGVYFIKNLDILIANMQHKDSIVSGMIGANTILENTFKRMGDIDDYYEAIGL